MLVDVNEWSERRLSRLSVAVEVMEEEARGTFTLKPWSQDGGTGELFDGVTFP